MYYGQLYTNAVFWTISQSCKLMYQSKERINNMNQILSVYKKISWCWTLLSDWYDLPWTILSTILYILLFQWKKHIMKLSHRKPIFTSANLKKKLRLININSIEMHLFTINPLNHKPIMSITLGRYPCRLG